MRVSRARRAEAMEGDRRRSKSSPRWSAQECPFDHERTAEGMVGLYLDLPTAYRCIPVLPRITPFDFGDEPIYAGQTAQCACMVPVGDTPIQIRWTHEGETLSQFRGYTVGKLGPRTSILQIETVAPEHAGRYACIASNPSGKVVHEATLRVHG
ncbi:hypothetical protein KM043_002941 [Ampulex compressa]|nr:hypothetical protein KM043_002941 [Ampulex compressa]